MTRQKVRGTDSMQDLAIKMGEWNPGGLNVVMQLLKMEDGWMRLLDLDDMNIRGSQIWVGYKDHCGEDINKFIEAIKNRDREMVSTVNRESGMFPEEVASTHRHMR